MQPLCIGQNVSGLGHSITIYCQDDVTWVKDRPHGLMRCEVPRELPQFEHQYSQQATYLVWNLRTTDQMRSESMIPLKKHLHATALPLTL